MAQSKDNGTVDSYGFERDENFDHQEYEDFMAKYLSVLARRAGKWSNMVNGSAQVMKKNSKLKRYCRKGIPAEHRGLVWMHTSGADERMRQNPDVYNKLLQGDHDQQLIETIKTDIPRTFPDNIYFQNTPSDPNAKRRPLLNVLLAIGTKNKDIGYCQGMNFIAGLLLLTLKDEEKVFWLMDTLINEILPPDYYTPEMTGVKADQELLGELVKQKMPDVARHLEEHGMMWGLICTKWFICVYADVLPVETTLRIWDSLFYEGTKIMFRVGVTLVKLNKDKILAAKSFPDLITVFKGLTHDTNAMNCHDFMQHIFTQPGSFSQSMVDKLRKNCLKKVLAES